ncbi:MAG: tetratricopeptide repeat protein [Terriglobales bacterium]|jgi:tol-pal system protein YbgF
MKSRCLVCASLVAALFAASTPGFAVNKDLVQLQTQVQQLQDQMARMQQSFDERMGIMRNLTEQQTDTINKVNANIQALEQVLSKQQDAQTARNEQVSGQIQALNDSLDEAKAKLAHISKQLDQMGSASQNISAPATGALQPPPGLASQPSQPSAPQAPPADMLYNNALRDYNSNNLDLAMQEFGDYLKYYPNTELAGNAQFYMADVEYRQANYEAAIKDYDKVLEQYPSGNKTPAAQLKKGMALIMLGNDEAGEKELKSLIQRYPRSIEATSARDQLRKLHPGAAKPGTTKH